MSSQADLNPLRLKKGEKKKNPSLQNIFLQNSGPYLPKSPILWDLSQVI